MIHSTDCTPAHTIPFPGHQGDLYEARQGGELIDVGCELVGFVQALLSDQAACLADGEIVVWRFVPGRGPRAVALLYPDGRGMPAVRWL